MNMDIAKYLILDEYYKNKDINLDELQREFEKELAKYNVNWSPNDEIINKSKLKFLEAFVLNNHPFDTTDLENLSKEDVDIIMANPDAKLDILSKAYLNVLAREIDLKQSIKNKNVNYRLLDIGSTQNKSKFYPSHLSAEDIDEIEKIMRYWAREFKGSLQYKLFDTVHNVIKEYSELPTEEEFKKRAWELKNEKGIKLTVALNELSNLYGYSCFNAIKPKLINSK